MSSVIHDGWSNCFLYALNFVADGRPTWNSRQWYRPPHITAFKYNMDYFATSQQDYEQLTIDKEAKFGIIREQKGGC